MHRLFRRSSLLKRYVVYNLCFVLIPLLLLIYIYWQSALSQFIDEYETTHRYTLTQVMRSMDESFETIRLMANQLSYDSELTPYQLQKSEYGRYKGISRIKTYHSHANFLDEMILYIRGDSTLYSSSGVLSTEYFINGRYQFIGDWNSTDLRDLINNSPTFGFSPEGCFLAPEKSDFKRKVVLTYPWGNQSGRFGTIIGLVDAEYFERQLTGIESDLNNVFFITNSKQEILFAAEHGISYLPEQVGQMLLNREDGIYHMKIGRSTHSVIVLHSLQNDWTYVSAFPQSQFNTRLFQIKTPVLVVLSAILLISIAAGILLAFRNYLPIQKLNQALGQKIPQRDGTGIQKKDELIEIGHSIQAMVQNNEGMKNLLEENRVMLAEQILDKILMQNIEFTPEYIERQNSLGIYLTGPCFCVIVFKPTRNLMPAEREAAVDTLRSLHWKYPHYSIEVGYQNYFAVIFNVDSQRDSMEKAAVIVRELLVRALQIEPVLGVGHTYDTASSISRSYSEAVSAAESSEYANDSTIFFDELRTLRHSSPYWYPPKAQLHLIQGLNQGNLKMVNESIDELSEMLHAQMLQLDGASLHFIISGIIQTIWPIVDKMKMDSGSDKIDALVHYSDIDAFISHLQQISIQMIEFTEKRMKSEQRELYEKILSYIERHYTDQGLGLKNLACQFDMTDSYLSRFFSNHSGMNFIDYLTQKRMTAASRLLIETDSLIRDVMERVGYVDLASFTRKFSQIFGISPGRFREKNRREKKNIADLQS